MKKAFLVFLFICFFAIVTLATETTTDPPVNDETEEPLEPIFPAPANITITPFVFTLSVPQSNVEGEKLWNLFMTLFDSSPECGGYPRSYNSAVNLWNTEHRLYIDQLNEACTEGVVKSIAEVANETYIRTKDLTPDPAEPTDPTDPVDPTEPTDPVDPTEPTDPVEPTTPFIALAKEDDEVPPIAAFTKVVREASYDLPVDLCFNDQTDELQCLAHNAKCIIKCAKGVLCTKDIQCGSSDCLEVEDDKKNDVQAKKDDEDDKPLRYCTSNATIASTMIAIVAIIAAVVM